MLFSQDALTDLSAQASLLTTSETGGEVYGHKVGLCMCLSLTVYILHNNIIAVHAYLQFSAYILVLYNKSPVECPCVCYRGWLLVLMLYKVNWRVRKYWK